MRSSDSHVPARHVWRRPRAARPVRPPAPGAPGPPTDTDTDTATPDTTLAVNRRIVAELFGPPETRPFGVRYWDAFEETPSDAAAPCTLVLTWPGALRRALLPPTERAVAEAYALGHVDLDGDLEAAVRLLGPTFTDAPASATLVRFVRLGRLLTKLPADRPAAPSPAAAAPRAFAAPLARAHSRRRDRLAVRHHYDLGNDFFALWLDPRMVYSCAYFDLPGDRSGRPTRGAPGDAGDPDLAAAQEAKLDIVCRKLRLAPGDRFLDIGCGWGALVLHAAARYGVHATGITLSPRQAELARTRIAAAGLEDRCRVELLDYRELPRDARFDKVASIGMVEHVGEARLRTYYDTVFRVLEPGGLFLNHGIVTLKPALTPTARLRARMQRRYTSFIERYIFPDAQLVGTNATLAPAEAAGFELRDVENLREHYAVTLRCWLTRLDRNRERAIELVGEPTYRVWRLYLAASAHQFASARAGVLQTLLARPDPHGSVRVPMTRHDLYAPQPVSPPGRTNPPAAG